MGDALSSYQKIGGANSRLAERFPNLAIYMELVEKQMADAKANANYSHDKSYINWVPETSSGTKYAWGDQSLRDFLFASDKQDVEVYVRSAAFNEYRNNVFLGCATDVYVYSHWGVLTTSVVNNYGYPSTSEYFTQAMNGDLSKISQSSTWQATVPGFETIPYEKFGRTVLENVDLFCPIVVAEEDFDNNMTFDDLFNKK